MRQRLGSLSESARHTVRVAAAASRPTLSLLRAAGRTAAIADLSEASDAGIASIRADGAVAFGHPLLRAAVDADTPLAARIGVHAQLAPAVADPIERARHLAWATVVEDETVAAALSDAAALARRRGAAGTAFELAGLAALRTPAADTLAWADRKVAQGWYGYAAGLVEEAQRAARDVLAADVPRPVRARAWMVLLAAMGQAIGPAADDVAETLADAAGDPDTEPSAWMHSAGHHVTCGRFEESLDHALRAADAAAATGPAEEHAMMAEDI